MQDGRQFRDLVGALGDESGVDLSPDRHGVVSIDLDDVTVSLESPDSSAVAYIHAVVRRLGPDRARDVETALKQNLFGLPLSMAWLALDGASDEILLCSAAPLAHLDVPALRAWLGAVAASVRELRDLAIAAPREAAPLQVEMVIRA